MGLAPKASGRAARTKTIIPIAGTDSSNPALSSGESVANDSAAGSKGPQRVLDLCASAFTEIGPHVAPTALKLAATAAAVPPLEPAGTRSSA